MVGLAPCEGPENLKHIKTDGWNHLTDRGFPWRSENISCEYDSDSEELQPRLGILIISLLALCGGCAVWKCLCFFTITIISVYNEQIYNLPSTGQITG